MSNSVRPHRWQPTRFLCPWDSPGTNTGVGCRFLLQCMKVKSESEVSQSCPTLSDPRDCSLPGSSIHGIFQARVLEWGASSFFKIQPVNESKLFINNNRYHKTTNYTLRGLRENSHQYGILYDTKKSLQNEGKIKGYAKQLLHNVL